jgi:hypothetical protein
MTRKPSDGFLCAMVGVAMTLLAWYGPWEWPAWPAFAVMRVAFGKAGADYSELPFKLRAAVLLGLIAVNVATWGGVVAMIGRVGRLRKRTTRFSA